MMFVDENIGGHVHAPAFGRDRQINGNLVRVIRLARLSGAAVIPAYATRQRGAQFTVQYLPPLQMRVTGDRDADIIANVALLNGVIEPIVRQHAEEWYMLMSLRLDR